MVTTLSLEITTEARSKLVEFVSLNPGFIPKVAAQSGGCSGFKYVIGLDHKQENDLEFTYDDGLVVLIPQESLDLLKNVILDYKKTFMSEGFSFSNPDAHSCGCGSSFRPKDSEPCE